jgi:hypothetical protein
MAEVNLEFMARCYLGDSFLASPAFIDIRPISAGDSLPDNACPPLRLGASASFLRSKLPQLSGRQQRA